MLGISPALSSDRLDFFFTSNKQGNGFNIYDVHRDSQSVPFPTVGTDPLLDNPASDTFDTMLSVDGTTLYYVAGDGNTGGTVYSAKADSSPRRWNGDAPDPAFSKLGSILHPTLTANGLDVYYAVHDHDVGTAKYHGIKHASRGSTSDAFDHAEDVAVSDIDWDEFNPAISPDGETLYYSTNNYVLANLNGEHVMKAHRSKQFMDISLAEELAQLDDDNYDMGTVHADGVTLVYSTSVLGNGEQPWIACE